MTDPVTPLTPDQAVRQEEQAEKEGYVHRTLVGLDIFVNELTGGRMDETISSRSARAAEAGKVWGRVMIEFLNLFQRNHGPKAQAGDIARAEEVIKLEKTSGGLE